MGVRSRVVRFAGRWLRRVAVVTIALVAGWVAAGYAEGHLPGTVTYSSTVRTGALPGTGSRAPATQPTPANQPTATEPTQTRATVEK